MAIKYECDKCGKMDGQPSSTFTIKSLSSPRLDVLRTKEDPMSFFASREITKERNFCNECTCEILDLVLGSFNPASKEVA